MLNKAQYYESIQELPLNIFIEIMNTSNYLLLKKSGKGKKEKAFFLWSKIIQEYNSLTENEGQKHIVQLLQFVALMELKIRTVNYCLSSLKMNFNQDLADFANFFGIRTKITRLNKYEGIKKAETELKRMISAVEDKKRELERIEEKNSNKTSKNSFESILLDLSKFQGYSINSKQMTVFEFCLLLNKYKEHIKNVNKRKNGK